MCSSSAALSEPDPVKANRWPQASGAKRPRSCGPNTRNVIFRSLPNLPFCRPSIAFRRRFPAERQPSRAATTPFPQPLAPPLTAGEAPAPLLDEREPRKARRGGCASLPAPILSLSNHTTALRKLISGAVSVRGTLTYACKPPVASSATFSITLCGSSSSVLMV